MLSGDDILNEDDMQAVDIDAPPPMPSLDDDDDVPIGSANLAPASLDLLDDDEVLPVAPAAPSQLRLAAEKPEEKEQEKASEEKKDEYTPFPSAPATIAPSTHTSASAPLSSLPASLSSSTSAAPPVIEQRSITPPDDAPYTLDILVEEFEKRGEGMNAYIVYKVVSESKDVAGMPDGIREVWRRFSDFLGLHDKLVEKFLPRGVVVPCPPEKSISAMTKTKTNNDPQLSQAVAVKRARLLMRFLRRVVSHPRMRSDCDVRDFLTLPSELPRAANTAALSSAGVKRLMKSVGEVFSKMAFHMEEGDRWFEQTQSQVEELDESLHRLLHIAETLGSTRKELAAGGEHMSKALSMLASCEESTALARALSHLTDTEENVAALWAKQADRDTSRLIEGVGEYTALIAALKEVFGERARVWQAWQAAQHNLARKREQKARLELAQKMDKATAMREEIDEASNKVDAMEKDFGDVSKLIQEEVGRFEQRRRADLRQLLIEYLESLLETQNEMVRVREKFLPETRSIIA